MIFIKPKLTEDAFSKLRSLIFYKDYYFVRQILVETLTIKVYEKIWCTIFFLLFKCIKQSKSTIYPNYTFLMYNKTFQSDKVDVALVVKIFHPKIFSFASTSFSILFFFFGSRKKGKNHHQNKQTVVDEWDRATYGLLILKKKFLFVHFHVTKNGLLHCTVQQFLLSAVGNRSEFKKIVIFLSFSDVHWDISDIFIENF